MTSGEETGGTSRRETGATAGQGAASAAAGVWRDRPARSWLFVPGDRPERFDRAWSAGADRVIVDLEDGVAARHKDQARAAVVAWLAPDHPVYVRINAALTPFFAQDLAAVCRPGLAGIILPKAEHIGPLRTVAAALAPLDATIVPLVETARGLVLARRLAASSSRIERLAFGALDLALDLGMTVSREEQELAPARFQVVLASRLAGLAPPIDGITAHINDVEALTMSSSRARNMGFGGKLAIHPRQIAPIHAAFAPSADEVAWAQQVVEASDGAERGAMRVDGMMIDRPVVERARQVLRQANV